MAVQYECTFKVGNMRLTIKTDESKRLFSEVGFFSSLPDQCPRCSSPVRISHREYEGYNYYELICDGSESQGVVHKAKVGEHLNDKGFFFRADQKWLTLEELKDGSKHYDDGKSVESRPQGATQRSAPPAQRPSHPPPPVDDDGLPF